MHFQILQVSNVLLYMLNKKDTRGEVISACQFKSKKTGKPYWAIQIDWNLPKPEVPKLRKHIIPLPVPEFGTIFHDVKLSTDCLETEKLSKPEEFNGVICHYRVNAITRTDNDKYCERSVYIEGGPRIGKQNAEGFKSLMERIYREEQQKLNQQFDEQTKPKRLITEKTLGDGTPITIKSRSVDHHSNRKEIATALLRKDYPNFFNAMDGLSKAKDETEKKKWAEKARRGLIVDLKKNTGFQLDAEGEAELLRDNAFINMLNEANEKPRKEPHPLDWELVLGWIIKGYYKMNEQELAANIKRIIEYGSKDTTIARHARDLGLETALKRGRPEKKEESF